LHKPEGAGECENRLGGRVERSVYLGNAFLLIVQLDIGCTV
jgi:hypothetical protein